MSKLYKFVSGKGKIEMTESEIEELKAQSPFEENEPESLSELSEKVDKILKALNSLKILSSFCSGNEGE